ncbi:Intermediate filament protein [Nowakowskiella sp. JEL0407]|nr:Intermediate filament protein [Nowakowskiella sp. JEL0407]
MIIAAIYLYSVWVWLFRWSPRTRRFLYNGIIYGVKTVSSWIFGSSSQTSPILMALSDNSSSPRNDIPPFSLPESQLNDMNQLNWWAVKYPIRPLAFTDSELWRQYEETRLAESLPRYNISSSPQIVKSSSINSVLENLFAWVIRDFVNSWYTPFVSRESAFPSHVGHLLRHIAVKISERIEGVDFVQFTINRIVPILTQHIKDTRHAERAFRTAMVQKAMNQNALNEYADAETQLAKYYKGGRLHNALTPEDVPTLDYELNYLRPLTEKILKLLCPENELKSKIVRIFLREVIASRILQPAVEYLADPDYWNQLIETLVDYLSAEDNVIDKLLGNDVEDLTLTELIGKDSTTFREFLGSIKDCNNVEQAYRVLDTITNEILKRKTAIANFGPDDAVHGVTVRDSKIYISRLNLAKKRLETRIEQLLTSNEKSKNGRTSPSTKVAPTLQNLLANPKSSPILDSFFEYLILQQRQQYLQFWFVVNGVCDIPDSPRPKNLALPTEETKSSTTSPKKPPKFPVDDETLGRRSSVITESIKRTMSLRENNDPSKWQSLADNIIKLYREYFSSDSTSKIDITIETQTKLDSAVTTLDWLITRSKNPDSTTSLKSPISGEEIVKLESGDSIDTYAWNFIESTLQTIFTIQDQVLVVLEAEDYQDFLKYQTTGGLQQSPKSKSFAERPSVTASPRQKYGFESESAQSSKLGKYNQSQSEQARLLGAGKSVSLEVLSDKDKNSFDKLDSKRSNKSELRTKDDFQIQLNSSANISDAYIDDKAGERQSDLSSNSVLSLGPTELTGDIVNDNSETGQKQKPYIVHLSGGQPRGSRSLSPKGKLRDQTTGGEEAAEIGTSASDISDHHRQRSRSPSPAKILDNLAIPFRKLSQRDKKSSKTSDLKLETGDSESNSQESASKSGNMGEKLTSFLKRNRSPNKKPEFSYSMSESNVSKVSPKENDQLTDLDYSTPEETEENKDDSKFTDMNSPVASFKRRTIVGGGTVHRSLKTINRHLSGKTNVDDGQPDDDGGSPETLKSNFQKIIDTTRIRRNRSQSDSGGRTSISDRVSNWRPSFKSRLQSKVGNEILSEDDDTDEYEVFSGDDMGNEEVDIFAALKHEFDENRKSGNGDDERALELVLSDEQSSDFDGMQLNIDDITSASSSSASPTRFSGPPDLTYNPTPPNNQAPKIIYSEIDTTARDSILDATMDIYWPVVLGESTLLGQVRNEILELQKEDLKITEELNRISAELSSPAISENQLQQMGSRKRQLVMIKSDILDKLRVNENRKYQIEMFELEHVVTPDRTSIHVPSATVKVEDSKEYISYMIVVTRSHENASDTGWCVEKRHSEIVALHNTLRARFMGVNQLELPTKPFTSMLKIQNSMVENRKVVVERYLQSLLQMTEISTSYDFRLFICNDETKQLIAQRESSRISIQPTTPSAPVSPNKASASGSSKKPFGKNLLQTVDDSVDGFLQKLKPQASVSLSTANASLSVPGQTSETNDSALWNSASQITTQQSLSAAEVMIDLMNEIFDMRESKNWLRRNTMAMLQQMFGGQVDRRIVDNLKWFFGEDNMLSLFLRIKDSFWPNGVWFLSPSRDPKEVKPARTPDQKRKTKVDAERKLGKLLPDLLGQLVGRQNAHKGAKRIANTFQNRKLNQQLVYNLLDEIVHILFSDLQMQYTTSPCLFAANATGNGPKLVDGYVDAAAALSATIQVDLSIDYLDSNMVAVMGN